MSYACIHFLTASLCAKAVLGVDLLFLDFFVSNEKRSIGVAASEDCSQLYGAKECKIRVVFFVTNANLND